MTQIAYRGSTCLAPVPPVTPAYFRRGHWDRFPSLTRSKRQRPSRSPPLRPRLRPWASPWPFPMIARHGNKPSRRASRANVWQLGILGRTYGAGGTASNAKPTSWRRTLSPVARGRANQEPQAMRTKPGRPATPSRGRRPSHGCPTPSKQSRPAASTDSNGQKGEPGHGMCESQGALRQAVQGSVRGIVLRPIWPKGPDRNPWYMVVLCRYGHIYLHGSDMLAASVMAIPTWLASYGG